MSEEGYRQFYILKGHRSYPEPDVEAWLRWKIAHDDDLRVAETRLDDVYISTVFLGINYNFSERGGPILFETMVFGGSLDQEMKRYAVWEEAEAGHAAMVERVRSCCE